MDDLQMELLAAIWLPNSDEYTRESGYLDDHLPLPNRRMRRRKQIPYYCAGKVYDNGSLLTYHSRRGLTFADVHEPQRTSEWKDEINEFFQNLLFFGFFEDVFGFPVNPHDFVQKSREGLEILTTKRLPEYVMNWFKRERGVLPGLGDQHAKRAGKAIAYICNIMHHWEVHQTCPFDDHTALYFTMLGQYIDACFRIVFLDKTDPEAIRDPGWAKSLMFNLSSTTSSPHWWFCERRWPGLGLNHVKIQMLEDGWCKSDVQRLESTLTAYGVYAASMLYPPGAENFRNLVTDARLRSTTSSNSLPAIVRNQLRKQHQQCSEFKCKAYETCESNYTTRHVFPACCCSHLETDVSSIVEILQKGQIPLIEIRQGFRIIPAKPKCRYVAISHVWADGLGNPNANSLPACQIIRLAWQCKALSLSPNDTVRWSNSPALFWIDTICCPVNNKVARAQAISLMAKTYKEAHRVLVLDSYLLSCSIMQMGAMEVLLTMYCSKWHRRLWCLQERLLAGDRIRFQFRDAVISTVAAMFCAIPRIEGGPLRGLPCLDFNPRELTNPEALRLLTVSQSNILGLTWGVETEFNHSKQSPEAVMSVLQNLLPFRSTSKAADEALCLAILLNVDVQKIIEASREGEDGRMKMLWRTLKTIPPDVIFWIGPRLQESGLKWAPKTFMNSRDLIIKERVKNNDGGNLTEKGLRVQFPGWSLGCVEGHLIKAQFAMVDANKALYLVSCLNHNTGNYYDPDERLNPWLEAGVGESKKATGTLYVLSRFDLDAASTEGTKVSHDAILVHAHGEELSFGAPAVHASFVCPVTVRRHGTDLHWTKSLVDWEKDAEAHTRYDAEKHKLGLWCYDSPDEPGIISLMGCSAFYESHPFIID